MLSWWRDQAPGFALLAMPIPLLLYPAQQLWIDGTQALEEGWSIALLTRSSLLVLAFFVLLVLLWFSRGPTIYIHPGATSLAGKDGRHGHRKVGSRLPCPYPDGWFCVAYSWEVPPGTVKNVTLCDQQLVIFRPQAGGAPGALDAYCPHLGAHMGVGGKVVDDCVQCPFHAWRFERDGTAASIPSSRDAREPVSLRVAARGYPCQDRNGLILVWFSSLQHLPGAWEAAECLASRCGANKDAAVDKLLRAQQRARSHGDSTEETCRARAEDAIRSMDRALIRARGTQWEQCRFPPLWEVPVFEPVEHGEWVFRGYTEHSVGCHIQEIPENGADVAHLSVLHRDFIAPSLGGMLHHRWTATWDGKPARWMDEDPEESSCVATAPKRVPQEGQFCADVTIKEDMMLRLPGTTVALPGGTVDVDITQTGSAVVLLRMQTLLGPVLIIETVHTIAPMHQIVRHGCWAPRWQPNLLGNFVLSSVAAQFERDLDVFCNKMYRARPALTREDPNIAKFRRWFAQFYRPGAVSFAEAVEAYRTQGLDW